MNYLSDERKHDLLMRSIKILDIGYIASLYFVIAMIYCIFVDRIFRNFDAEEEDKKSLGRVIAESILYMWFIGVSIYIVRNLMEFVPFPLNGYHGFMHLRVKELGNATVFTTLVMMYDTYFRSKLAYLFARIQKEYYPKINILQEKI